MGCISSRQRGIDSNPRVFKVYNMDERGQELSAGRMQVTDSELILYQINREPIRWPLRSLRRYGFEAELFSFESGRRCPTGPGIYAFRCQRAEAWFNLLQDSIQRAGQHEQETRSAPIDSAIPVTNTGVTHASRPPSSLMEMPNTAVSPSHSNANVNQHAAHYVNDAHIENNLARQSKFLTNQHEYVNAYPEGAGVDSSSINMNVRDETANGRAEGVSTVTYAKLDLPSRSSMEDVQDVPSATYMNVQSGDRLTNGSAEGSSAWTQRPVPPDSLQASSTKRGKDRVQYIQLDLKKSDDNLSNGFNNPPSSPISLTSSAGPESPTRKQVVDEYSTIDFNKTAALSNSAKMQSDKSDEGLRKTRHNSNIDDLN